jgi:hypothetical protein
MSKKRISQIKKIAVFYLVIFSMRRYHKQYFISTLENNRTLVLILKKIGVFYHEIYSMKKYPIPTYLSIWVTSLSISLTRKIVVSYQGTFNISSLYLIHSYSSTLVSRHRGLAQVESFHSRGLYSTHNSLSLLTNKVTLHLNSVIFCLKMSHRVFPFPYINSSQIKHNSLIVKVKANSHVIWFMRMLLFRKSRNKFASTWTKISICHKITLHCLWREPYNIKFTNNLSSLCNNSLNKLFKNPSKSTRIGEITLEN